EGLIRLARDDFQRIIQPFPDVAGHLVDTVWRGAPRKSVYRHDGADAGGREVGPLGVEEVAPGIAAATAPGELLGPAAGFLPFRGGGQALADPASISHRFIPANTDHRMLCLSRGKRAILPVAWTGLPGPVGEADDAGPDFRRPDLKRVVAAGLDELV